MSYFCIRFSPADAETDKTCSWALVDDGGRLLKDGALLLSQMAEQISLEKADRVIVLLAGDRVLTATVDVEKSHLAHIKQVIPSLIEEQLAEDLDDVHIAFPASIGAGTNNVAVVSHIELIDWLDELYSVNIRPTAIMPDYLFLPPADADIKVFFDDNDVLFQYNGCGGSTIEYEHLPLYMDMLIAEHKVDLGDRNYMFGEEDLSLALDEQPLTVCLQASGVEAVSKAHLQDSLALLKRNHPAVEFSTKLFEEPSFPLLAMMSVREHEEKINLLQGGYKVKETKASGFPWKKTAVIGGLFLAAELVLFLGSGWWFSGQAEHYEEQAVSQYREIFPNERRVPNPRLQFQSHLNQLHGGGATKEFMWLLQTASEQMPAEDIKLAALRFDSTGSGLMLDVRSSTIDVLESYAARIEEHSISVELLSAVENGNSVSGRLQLGAN